MLARDGSDTAVLALEDGKVFRGRCVGWRGETSGEVVFNTSMSGYQEILTDPSYSNQIITFTYPHIGNVGVNAEDIESDRICVSGAIMRDISGHYSNFRASRSLGDYLVQNKVVAISDIDTRELVLHIRSHGAMMGVISCTETNIDELVDRARVLPKIEGLDLVKSVTTSEPYDWTESAWQPDVAYARCDEAQLEGRPLVAVLDFGVKYNILRMLLKSGFRVVVLPAGTSPGEIQSLSPDAVFLSNGPGDPAAVTYAIRTVGELLGKKPMFGICLGHQILGLALGAATFKLKFGHRGANHPVRDCRTGRVDISVQNHGFAVDAQSLPSGVVQTHTNLNDQTVEGLEAQDLCAFGVQYHPEASAGPHDASYLFDHFFSLLER